MAKPIENVANIINPTSLEELRLAVTSSQQTKAFVLLYNIVNEQAQDIKRLTEESAAKATTRRKAATSDSDG